MLSEREEGREEERETHIDAREREASIGCLLYMGITHAQAGDQTSNSGLSPDGELNPPASSYGMMLQQMEPHWQGVHSFLDVYSAPGKSLGGDTTNNSI